VIYCSPFGKSLVGFRLLIPSAKPGNETESRIYVGWVKMAVQFEAVCGPQFTFLYDVGDPW